MIVIPDFDPRRRSRAELISKKLLRRVPIPWILSRERLFRDVRLRSDRLANAAQRQGR